MRFNLFIVTSIRNLKRQRNQIEKWKSLRKKEKHVQKKKLIDAHQKILNFDIGADNEGCTIDSSQWTYNMVFSGKKYSAVKI